MSLSTHAERLQARLDKIKTDERSATERVVSVGEFVGGVCLSSGYRAWLAREGKAMPKIGGMDADTVVGGALLVAGFLDAIPRYSDHAMHLGAGMVSGAIGNMVAGKINTKVAVKGEVLPHQMGAGSPDVSAYHGQNVVDMIRGRHG